MFVRYKFDAKSTLQVDNNLIVRFTSPITYSTARFSQLMASSGYPILPECQNPLPPQGECHANIIRKVQSSFSWDWGPSFPTMGLWHPVIIEASDTALIRDFWINTYPSDATATQWRIDMKIHCETPDVGIDHTGSFNIVITDKEGKLITNFFQPAVLRGGNDRLVTVALNPFYAQASQVDPWMPNGWGRQTLYNIKIDYTEGFETSTINDRIGFRTVELVEDPMKAGYSYYFRINGEPVFIKGSNWIPSAILPELITEDYLRRLLTAAKKANMNALRVWGGGMYEFDSFYRIADELGILIWHDMMYACSMYPADELFLGTVSIEVRQQIRRLSHHPSILIWAGNNENEAALRQNWYGTQSLFETYKQDYVKLYIDTIRTIVKEEDPSRPYTASSPSNGKHSDEEGYVAENPGLWEYGDVHYYNYGLNANCGDGPGDNMWTWESYVILNQYLIYIKVNTHSCPIN